MAPDTFAGLALSDLPIDEVEAQDLTQELIEQRYDDADYIWAAILRYAIERLPRDEALEVMRDEVEAMRAGVPLPPFISIMEEARDWAAWAIPAERKAYALACYETLTQAEQAAFLAHINGEAAA